MEKSDALKKIKKSTKAALNGKEWEKGAQLLREWCALRPDDPKGWFYRAYCAAKLGKVKNAVAYAKKAVNLNPNHTDAKNLLATLKRSPSSSPAPPQPPPSDGLWRIGSVVDGRYEVKGSKRGGMGEVYFAYDRRLEHMVAVKAPLPSVLKKPEQKARFYREAEAWVGLGMHPNICSAYYVQEIDGIPWLFIEYVAGGTLDDWIKEKTMSMRWLLDTSIQIAVGMNHTHTCFWQDAEDTRHKGLVHRDLKPANILMDKDGVPKVTDFGLVSMVSAEDKSTGKKRKAPSPGEKDRKTEIDKSAFQEFGVDSDIHWQTITVAGGAVGTPPYMGPEQWQRAHEAGPAADVYAYGCILYEIFCKRRPFALDERFRHAMPVHRLYEWEKMHREKPPPDPRDIIPTLNDRLSDLMLRCLNKDPDDRPDGFQEIQEELKAIFAEEEGDEYQRPEPRKYRLLADSLNNQGVSFITIGQGKRAQTVWREALKTAPHHIEATYNMALFEWEYLGITYDEIFRRMEEVGNTYKNNLRHKKLMGRMCLFFGEYSRAVSYLEQATGMGEPDIKGLRDLGLALCAQAGLSEIPAVWIPVQRAFGQVMELDYEDPAVITGYALSLWRQGKYDEGEKFYQIKTGESPELPATIDEAIHKYLPGQEVIDAVLHVGWVNHLSFTPDKTKIFCGGENKASLWMIRPERKKPHDEATPPPILEQAPDEKTGGSSDTQSLSWTITPESSLYETLLHGGDIIAVAINLDGSLALSGNPQGLIRLHDINTGEVLRTMQGHDGEIRDLAFSTDQRFAISGSEDKTLRLWDVKTGDALETFEGHTEAVSTVTFSKDGRYVASGSEDSTVRLWNSYNGAGLAVFEGHKGKITCISFTPDSEFLVSAGEDRTIQIWHIKTQSRFYMFTGHERRVNTLGLSPDGKFIISGSDDRTLRLWDIRRKRLARIFHFHNRIENLSISHDGRLIVLVYTNTQPVGTKTISLMQFPKLSKYQVPYVVTEPIAASLMDERETEFRTKVDVARKNLEEESHAKALLFIKEARSIPGYERDSEALLLWEKLTTLFPSLGLRTAWELEILTGHGGGVMGIALNKKGQLLLSGSRDKTVRLWDLENVKCLSVLEWHTSVVTSVGFYERDHSALSGSSDYSLRVWDLEATEAIRALIEHSGEITSLAVSPDGLYAATGSRDHTIRIWELNSLVCIRILEGHQDCVNAVTFNPNGSLLFSGGSDKTVRIWDMANGENIRILKKSDLPILDIAVSPDGRHVISAGEDKTLRRWELGYDTYPETFRGHTGEVTCVDISPDNRYAISGCTKGNIIMWDLKSGKGIRVFLGHSSGITALLFGPDRQFFVSSGLDGTIRKWQLDWEPDVRPAALWDNGAGPFLETFLDLHTPYAAGTQSRKGRARWTDDDFEELLKDLTNRGFGWLKPEGVKAELKERAHQRKRLPQFINRMRKKWLDFRVKGLIKSFFRGILDLVIRLVPATIWTILMSQMDWFGLPPILAGLTILAFVLIMFLKRKKD